MPRPRPPFPAQQGLWGKPTLINNVETLANVRHIIIKEAEWVSSIGTKKSKGTKVVALVGKVKNTGLIDASIDYEAITKTGAIMGSGGFIVMDEKTCMVDMARFFLEFTVAESCGKCVPCRVGLKRMLEILEKITEGKGKKEHIKFLQKMSTSIKDTALCGLGNTAPNPVLTTVKYFPDEYKTHIENKKCPAHVCTKLLKFEVIEEKCTKCGKCHESCPVNAIAWKKKDYPKINKDKCIKCKACINTCDFKAIQ